MKIKISYTEGEEWKAEIIEVFLKSLLPFVKVHKSSRHPPFKLTYFSTERPLEDKETP